MPNLDEKIRAAQAAGYSLQEIQGFLQQMSPAQSYQAASEQYGGYPGTNTFDMRLGQLMTRGEIPSPPGTGASIAEAAPAALAGIAGPGGLLGSTAVQGLVAGAQEVYRPGSTLASIGKQAAWGAGGNLAGFGAGQIAGRVKNAIVGAASSIGQKMTLDSGIRQSLGSALGSKTVQMAEAGLARNPITGMPFSRMDAQNQAVLGKALNRFLGVGDELPIEKALQEAYEQSTTAINAAIPDKAVIPISDDIVKKYKILRDAGEGLDLPEDMTGLTGRLFKDARSDLTAALKSQKAGVRRTARKAIDLMDEAAAGVPGVNQELYTQGRHQYRAWKTAVKGKAVSEDFKRVNESTLLRNLEGSYGQGAVKAGQSTGFPEVDDMIASARDAARVKNPVPNSGTPTGAWLPALGVDIATTGGIGTAAALGASALSQTGPGLGAATGLLRNPELEAKLAGILAAAKAKQLGGAK